MNVKFCFCEGLFYVYVHAYTKRNKPDAGKTYEFSVCLDYADTDPPNVKNLDFSLPDPSAPYVRMTEIEEVEEYHSNLKYFLEILKNPPKIKRTQVVKLGHTLTVPFNELMKGELANFLQGASSAKETN